MATTPYTPQADTISWPEVDAFIWQALKEDIGPGDHTTLSTIPKDATGRARCLIKGEGVLAGVAFAERVFQIFDERMRFEPLLPDGTLVQPGQEAFHVHGTVHSLLTCERLVLNVMQRMSGIATKTWQAASALQGSNTKLLDTRKTTPLLRYFEKWAVRIGGGYNHRMGLYDMILIKDNHIDFAGGVGQALAAAKRYLHDRKLDLPIVVETRNLQEAQTAVEEGGATRLLLDNMTNEQLSEAVAWINGRVATEASGGVTVERLPSLAQTGVNYVSMGALTHSFQSLDISLKAF